MSNGFAFKGHTRRIARALVDTMVPRWPEFDPGVTDRVLDDVENSVRHFPLGFRAAFLAGLWGLEVASPLLDRRPVPFSRADEQTRERRLRALHGSRIRPFRQAVQLYGVFVTASAYSQPDVEAHLGVERRSWREARRRFRERLVRLEAGRPLRPATPEALGSDGVASAEDYLASGETAPPSALRAVGG